MADSKPVGCVVVHGTDEADLRAVQDRRMFKTIEALLDGVRRGEITRLHVVVLGKPGTAAT